MGEIFSLTGPGVRVTTTTAVQSLELVFDAIAYDEMCIQAMVLGFEGPTSPSFTVGVDTAMQRETTDGWLSISSFLAISAVGVPQSLTLTKGGFFRYLRWNVSNLSGATGVSFYISGVARSYPSSSRAMR